MKYRIISVDKYRDPSLAVTLRGEDGKRYRKMIQGFKPYMYVESEPEHEELKALDGTSVRKMRFGTWAAQRDGKNDFTKTWEADVPPGQRWMIDTGVMAHVDDNLKASDPVDVNVTKMYWDIEVAEPTKQEALDTRATGRIVSITTLIDDQMTTFYVGDHRSVRVDVLKGYTREWPWTILEFPTEQRMLEAFAQYVSRVDPDMLVGFNSEDYDWPMTVNRSKKLAHPRNAGFLDKPAKHLRPVSLTGWVSDRNCPGRQLVDLMQLYTWSRLVKEKFYSLGHISAKHGIEVDKSAQAKVFDLWKEKKFEELIVYNARDVELNWFIDQKENLTDFAMSMQEMTGVDDLMDVTKASVVADVLCLREAYQMGRPLPTRDDDASQVYEGGEVLEPRRTGVIRNVAVYDFSRLYPSLIVALNISPETYQNRKVTWAPEEENIYEFDRKSPGLLANVVKRAFTLRDYCDQNYAETGIEQWNLRSQATKKIINGIYGALGYTRFRLYQKEVAESVTGAGRFLIKGVDSFLQTEGEEPIYGDTDSVFVQTDDVARTTEVVNRAVKHTCSIMGIEPLKIKHEKTYWSVLMGGKKRYTGIIIWKDGEWLLEPKRETKGFEERRSDSSQMTAEVQSALFDMLLRDEPRERVLQYVMERIHRVARGDVDPSVCAPMPQISKEPDKYESSYQPIVAAKYTNKWLGGSFRKGDRIHVLYVKRVPPGCPKTHVVAMEAEGRIPEGVEVDWQLMAAKTVGEKAAKIFGICGWTHEAARCLSPFDRKLTEWTS